MSIGIDRPLAMLRLWGMGRLIVTAWKILIAHELCTIMIPGKSGMVHSIDMHYVAMNAMKL